MVPLQMQDYRRVEDNWSYINSVQNGKLHSLIQAVASENSRKLRDKKTPLGDCANWDLGKMKIHIYFGENAPTERRISLREEFESYLQGKELVKLSKDIASREVYI
jgi:hypothetical protein